jgi:predicted site-specific integrase-resolvase
MEAALKFMGPRGTSRLSGVETSTIYSWIRTGHLPAFGLLCGYFRIREADIQTFLTPVGGKKKGKRKHGH